MVRVLMIVAIAFIVIQHTTGKLHSRHHNHLQKHYHKKTKRDLHETPDKKSDYYGYRNDEPSNTDASHSFMDMSQPQGPYHSEEHHREVAETAERLSHPDQKDLDEAYNYVMSNNRFDHGHLESPDPSDHSKDKSEKETKTAAARSSVYPVPNLLTGYGDESIMAGSQSFYSSTQVSEPVEKLNPNEFEHDINLGSQTGTINYNQNYATDSYEKLAAVHTDGLGDRKSNVPDDKSHIPPNATHAAGLHQHLTDDAIISHVGNQPNYTGVSRYPPYVLPNGTQVVRTTPNNPANPSKPLTLNNDGGNNQAAYQQAVSSQPYQGSYPNWPYQPAQMENNQVQNSYQSKVNLNSTSKPGNISQPQFTNPAASINQVIPDISQITSPGSDASPYPLFPLPKPKQQILQNNSKQDSQGTNLKQTPSTLQHPVVAKIGSGGDDHAKQEPPNSFQYPVTLVNFGQSLQAYHTNNNPQTVATILPHSKNVSAADSPLCKNYPTEICYQPWMQKHCSKMCENANLTEIADRSSQYAHEAEEINGFPQKQPVNHLECNEWSTWSTCSEKCGFGKRVRFMDCFVENRKTTYNETKQCYLKDCPPVCGAWSHYTECSKTCGGGFQTRSSNCSVTDNIHTDFFEYTESQICNPQPCPPEKASNSIVSQYPQYLSENKSVSGTPQNTTTVQKLPQPQQYNGQKQPGPYIACTKQPCLKTTAALPQTTPTTTKTKECLVSSYGGNSNGACCYLPFVYNGQLYYSCVTPTSGIPWCATTSSYDQDKLWGQCGACITPPCLTTTTPSPQTTTTLLPQSTTTPKTTTSTTLPTTTSTTSTTLPTTTSTTSTTLPTTTSTTSTTLPTTTSTTSTTLPTTTSTTSTFASTTISTTTKGATSTSTTTTPSTPTKTKECKVPSYGGNSNGSCCHLPFVYNSQSYYSCVNLASGIPWCATTSSYDQDKLWGQCGACITPPCLTTTLPPPQTTTTPKTTTSTTLPTTSSTTSTFSSTITSTTTKGATSTSTTTTPSTPKCNEWSTWSTCSENCGFGKRVRFMDCYVENRKTTYNETKQCYLQDCPPVCNVWSNYTECSKTCGGGFQTHSRNCSVTDNIHKDIFEYTESRLCNPQPCPPECTAWSSWGRCSSEGVGGPGKQSRFRLCTWIDLGRKINVPSTDCRDCNSTYPVMCGKWSEFSECTKTCDSGEQTRHRECTIGNVTNVDKESISCNTQPCQPPFCGEWSAYTDCTATCDGGIKLRWRTCGGKYVEQNMTCNEQPCAPITHEDWSEWSDCSATCGVGHQTRNRTVTLTYRNGTIQTYQAPEVDERVCPGLPQCPTNETSCEEWVEWSGCSATCNGMQTRVRHCKNDTHEFDELQARPCNTNPCPANCTNWSDWSECSVTCGGGFQQRYRTCEAFQQDIETRACSTQSCATIPVPDCIVAYLSFDNFDVSRKIIYDEGPYGNNGGYDGEVEFIASNFSCGEAGYVKKTGEIFFNGSSFKNIPSTGITIAFWIYAESLLQRQSIFSTRSDGSQFENLMIDVDAGKVHWTYNKPNGVSPLFSLSSDAVMKDKDWVHVAVTYNSSTGTSNIFINADKISSVTNPGGNLYPNWDLFAGIAGPLYNERFSGFLDEFYIYNCSLTEEQIREVANTCKKEEGEGCPSPLLGVCPLCEYCLNTTTTPPVEPTNGNYSEWSEWGICSATCGGGLRARTRECNNPEPKNGGLECTEQPELGLDTEMESCNENPCPVDGEYCEFQNWTQCSTSCGVGTQMHARVCECPKPLHGGKPCSEQRNGAVSESRICPGLYPCPRPGNYSNWTPWSLCSVTCEIGTQTRRRKCDNPTPAFGGEGCNRLGPDEEKQDCFNEPMCGLDCSWNGWSQWSQCSRSCGNGFESRNRTKQPAMYGGKDCEGLDVEYLPCKLGDCCTIPYKRLGCFKDPQLEPRPLPELLFTDRDPQSNLYIGKPVHGLDFQGYVTDLICRCAEAAKNRSYTHFGIQNFGECLSGPTVKTSYDKYGNETEFNYRPKSRPWTGCMDFDHNACNEDSLTCVGMEDTNFVYGLQNVTPTDGNYSQWGNWSDCAFISGNCGAGTQHRTRTCTNPQPTFGGRNCSHLGMNTEEQHCSKNCPEHGSWGNWSEGPCSVSCGDGYMLRQRFCDSPSAAYGGNNCDGDAYEQMPCNLGSCPVNCAWTYWSDWSVCSVTCGNGTHNRQRFEEPALFNGAPCEGDAEEVQNCTTFKSCPENGGYSTWSSWTQCTKTCGTGRKERTRTCTNPSPFNGGLDCISQKLGVEREELDCNTNCCPVNGKYNNWSDWSECTATCGEGTHTRNRHCTAPAPSCGGLNCSDVDFEVQNCNGSIPCPIDGKWTDWSLWSDCSKTCGFGGIRTRLRNCSNPSPMYNGKSCDGEAVDIRNCTFEKSCCNLNYTHLGCYNDLSTTTSSMPLPQELFDDQENIDLDNWDEYLDELVCRCAQQSELAKFSHFGIEALGKCLSGTDAQDSYDRYGPSTACVTTGGNPRGNQFAQCATIGRPCAGSDKTVYAYGLTGLTPIDGNYTMWSQWSACFPEFGEQCNKTRYRTCTNPSSSFGGKTCLEQKLGPEEETDYCPCKHLPVDCQLSEWSTWMCSVTCGQGIKQRQRAVIQPALYGGANCSKSRTENSTCVLAPCQIDGEWADWSDWVPSATCGSQVQHHRSRQCIGPLYGGKPCSGNTTEIMMKNLEACPVDGGWCVWQSWSSCSTTCGLGNSNRVRECKCPEPANSGSPCIGASTECKDCNITGCPVNGGYSTWTLWTQCDQSCGNGTKTRSRSCSNPAPTFGGKTCIEQNLGESEDHEFCFLKQCPVDGQWSAWSSWTGCSLSCGEGRQIRERKCNNPQPTAGSNNCPGKDTSVRLCKQTECCNEPYEVLGCFQNVQSGTKAFTEVLTVQSDSIGMITWESILPSLICECATLTKQKGYSHFGILNLSECWSGSNVQNTFNVHGPSNHCLSMTPVLGSAPKNLSAWEQPLPNPENYEECLNGSLQCAGTVGTVYVYGVNPKGEGDGGYTNWSPWSDCTKSCGGGIRTAERSCTNPWPYYGGNDCTSLGEATKEESCNNQPCSSISTWGLWSSWSGCSVTCGAGVMERTRNCVNPLPSSNNIACSTGQNGTLAKTMSETVTCKLPSCPLPYSGTDRFAWSDWSTCSKTCGIGDQTRQRDCSTATADNPCPCPKVENRLCNVTHCPIDGAWSSWSTYSDCSTSCGCGNETKTRVCFGPFYGGKLCVGKADEIRACNCDVSCPRNGNYTQWSGWSTCSVTCGSGTISRSRTCSNPIPVNGGLTCKQQNMGEDTENRPCSLKECEQPCLWSEWEEWKPCDTACYYGKQVRSRAFSGNCTGPSKQSKDCYTECCNVPFQRLSCYQSSFGLKVLFNYSDNAHVQYNDWNNYLPQLVCQCAEKSKAEKHTHFALGDLGVCLSGPTLEMLASNKTYFPSSSKCVSKTTDPVSPNNNSYVQCQTNDQHCAGSDETSMFVYGLENIIAVDCGYSPWSMWTTCSVSCNNGTQESIRSRDSPPASFGGKPCTESTEKTQACYNGPCPINGNWSSWSTYTDCDVTCGGGRQTRERQCNNPPPQYGGLACFGEQLQAQLCNNVSCPINGNWSEWSHWSECSATCGPGARNRLRQCNNPAPLFNGLPCIGSSNETLACNIQPCYNNLTEWSEWTHCNVTCGTGYRSRSRACPVPPCLGDLTETEVCQKPACMKGCNRTLDLGFLVDFSHTINPYFSDYIKPFIKDVALKFEVSNAGTHIAYLPYSTVPSVNLSSAQWFSNDVISTIQSGDKNSQNNYLDWVISKEEAIAGVALGQSYLNKGLSTANDVMFTTGKGMRDNVGKVLIVVTDGSQTHPEGTVLSPTLKEAADKIKAKDVTIIAVGVGKDVNQQNLEEIVTNPTFSFHVLDYSGLETLTPAILNVTCIAHWGNWGNWTSCSVTCGDGERERTRKCEGGKPGEGTCVPVSGNEEVGGCNLGSCPCHAKIDLGYLVDFSGSIQQAADEELIKSFVKDTAMTFDISAENTHFSYIPFSVFGGDYSLDQWFNGSTVAKIKSGDKVAQRKYLDEIVKKNPPVEGWDPDTTFTYRAMKLADEKMWSESYGMRADVPKYMVVISDGHEMTGYDENFKPVSSSSYLPNIKKKGVNVIAIGVGPLGSEFKTYASKEEWSFKFSDLKELTNHLAGIASALCPVFDNGIPSNDVPNIATPTPTNLTTKTPVVITTPVTPATTSSGPYHCRKPVDIVFLVDGSKSIEDYWTDIQTFLKNVVDAFDFGNSGAQISIVVYSTTAKTEINMEEGKDKATVDFLIDQMRPLGSTTRIDKALRYASEVILAEGHGNRNNVTDVVVLLTDGKSDADSEDLSKAVKPLKDKHVYVIAVGLGNDTSYDELLKVATSRRAVYVIEDYKKVTQHVDNLAKNICDGPEKVDTADDEASYSCEPSIVYSFDLTCGKNVYDESRRGNDAVAGPNTGSYSFDEVTGKCRYKVKLLEGGFLTLDGRNIRGKPTDSFTLAVWLSLIGNGKIHPIFSVLNSKNQGQYLLEVRPEGSIHLSVKFGESVVVEMTTVDNVFSFNEWVHLTVTYNHDEEGKIYVNGRVIAPIKIAKKTSRETTLLPGDWNGFVSIGKENPNKKDKQLIGSVDEFHLFACVLPVHVIQGFTQTCGRYEPRPLPFAGTRYEIFGHMNGRTIMDVKQELSTKSPTETRMLDLFEAPRFDNATDIAIGTGQFAAKLSGYFIAPLTAEYMITLQASKQGALYMNQDKPSIESEAVEKIRLESSQELNGKRSFVVKLQGGSPYYMEAHQLSSDKRNELKVSFDVRCNLRRTSILSESPISKINIAYDLPRNCSSIHQNFPKAPDDEYIMRVQSQCQPIRVYCRNMAGKDSTTSQIEYLTLNSGPEENFAKFHRSRLINFNSCSGKEEGTPNESENAWGQTWFQRVHFNPSNMIVSRNDYTFATNIGNNVQFGTAGDCYSKSTEDCRKGEFRIDFKGTGMKITDDPKWASEGYPSDNHRITQFKLTDQSASAHCGGSCSVCKPSTHIRLRPEVCASGVVDSSSSPHINVRKGVHGNKSSKKKRTIRSIWSWWPWSNDQ